MSDQAIDVLLVEDNPGDARLVVELLRDSGPNDFRMTHVATVAAGIAHLSSGAPTDAVLLDLSLPDESGLDTVRRIVASAGSASVVVMTGAGDEELGLAAMQEGAQDYLVKGSVDGRMLRRAVRYAIQRNDMKRQLESLTLKDDLTGLNNRRGFMSLAEQQLKVSRRNQSGCLLLFIDLDGLKYVNDTLGHSEGNRAIVEAASVLRDCFRQSDIIGRLGGDEFAALALSSGEADETAVRGRLNAALLRVNGRPDRAYPLGFSVGAVACLPEAHDPIEALLARADELMYEEKRRRKAGRDAISSVSA